jgi:ATP-dependent Lon protease
MARTSRTARQPRRKGGRSLTATSLPAVSPRSVSHSSTHPEGVANTSLPAEVARQAQREMNRLRRLPAGSPEAGQVRAYLQWLWEFPWNERTPEDADLQHVEKVLDLEVLGLDKAKHRIVEYLAVRRLKPDLPGPALCLVGPPGTGKSSLAAAVARALGRPFVRIGASGATDAGDVRGIERGLPGAAPGKIARALREAGTSNPVLLFDGVDRIPDAAGSGVSEALLELLDPEASEQFTDHYLELPVDLSHAVLILCANTLEMIPDALQERLEVIEVPGYSEDEKIEIAKRFLLPRLLHDHGLSARDLEIPEDALRAIVRYYTLEAGVRSLSRQIAMVCRKVARARATGSRRIHRATVGKLDGYLGHRIFTPEMVGKSDEVGVATGLAWTAAGGEILVVEALKMPGQGRVVTTGQLGEVMRESVQAAHSYVRSRAEMLEIDVEAFNQFDIHIHFPAGGVPKDGPSAGITVGLVIASVLSDRPIRHDIAMTGEVSLRGRALLVGGMREKSLAAYRAGFRAMLFPAANIKDLDEVPADVRERLELIPVETMDDVFEHALHRVILPNLQNGQLVIEIEDDEEEEQEAEPRPLPRSARKAKRFG